MQIKIKGYKNIDDLEYDLVDNKLNVLVGISGSGKSAVIEALTNQEFDFNKKINYVGDVVSEINGTEPKDISVFNDVTVDKYLFSSEKNDNIYIVLIDDEQKLLEAREALDNRVKNIQILIKSCESEYQSFKEIQNQLGAALTPKGKIKATSAISKMRTSIQSLGEKQLYRKIALMDEKKVDWIIKGVSLIENSRCPFCDKLIKTKKDTELHEYLHIDLENQKKINLRPEQLRLLNTSGIQLTLNGLSKLEEEIVNIGIALKEFEKLSNDISYLYDTDVDINNIKLTYEPQLVNVFPSLKDELKLLKKHIGSLQKNVIKAIDNTKRVLSNRLNYVNDTIEKFGIPYKMEAIYKKSKITSYKLYHVDDLSKIDREKGLSNGEKKIISLIFFILENAKKPSNLIVFDDPVSSYDDNRRLSIFTYILEQLKNRTVLILSHDQVFAKFAVGRSGNQIGKVDYFDNYGNITIHPITRLDFLSLNTYIRDKIKSSTNYIQKIINLRYYYEIYKKGTEYSYLSRILHKENLASWLTTKGIDESTLIGNLKIEFEIDLDNFDENQYLSIDTSSFSLLEKMYLLREGNILKKLKDELSNHIHLNSKYAITLNPYKFSFCTKYVYDAIITNIPLVYNM